MILKINLIMGKLQEPNRLDLVALENAIMGKLLSIPVIWKSLMARKGMLT